VCERVPWNLRGQCRQNQGTAQPSSQYVAWLIAYSLHGESGSSRSHCRAPTLTGMCQSA